MDPTAEMDSLQKNVHEIKLSHFYFLLTDFHSRKFMKFICKNKNALRTSYNIPLISTKNSGGSTVILRFEV